MPTKMPTKINKTVIAIILLPEYNIKHDSIDAAVSSVQNIEAHINGITKANKKNKADVLRLHDEDGVPICSIHMRHVKFMSMAFELNDIKSMIRLSYSYSLNNYAKAHVPVKKQIELHNTMLKMHGLCGSILNLKDVLSDGIYKAVVNEALPNNACCDYYEALSIENKDYIIKYRDFYKHPFIKLGDALQ